MRAAVWGLVLIVAVAVVVFIAMDPPEPSIIPTTTQQAQPRPAGTTAPEPQALRRMRLGNWTWDASSITLTVTNTGEVFSSGTAQCRVEFATSGVMWPQIPLRGLDPGQTSVEKYFDLWAAGNAPVAVPECIIADP